MVDLWLVEAVLDLDSQPLGVRRHDGVDHRVPAQVRVGTGEERAGVVEERQLHHAGTLVGEPRRSEANTALGAGHRRP
ncbi:MAG: hypothetical protein AVDCRST_MAG20-2371 [uncultured Acidimicrobiales bacterium]|uniref:Uncharacterized protein n=1 Tax=uncultured Acidimicrobiales bacterium TaxID=310071 RepID=A0A6J4ILQ2_9ACTN|nr:MAG: hypothetical protein AVDCRST_MAG20-2371 [uncultured Acidimicrobiales bacterium]